MRRLIAVLGLVLVSLPACGSDTSSGDSTTRTVITDFNYDEFATSYFGFFPLTVKVHPGDTIDFKQAWTGEPHTVTMGTLVQPLGNAMEGYLKGTTPVPEGPPPAAVLEAERNLPPFFGKGPLDLNQTAAQPCYLDAGPLPADGKPCPQVEEQPAFSGRQAYYNSGFIPYEGNNGNHFEVPLAEDIAEGSYYYYCNLHGAAMGGYIEVRPESEEIPGQGEVNRTARAELAKTTTRVVKAHKEALKGEGKPEGADVVAGAGGYDSFPPALSLEFYPSTFRTKVGQKVTWAVNDHTVSFNVPKYGPQIIVEQDGTVKFNPKAVEAVNAPEPPPRPRGDGPPPPGPPPPLPAVDAGDLVPGKFISSGVQDELFSLTFTKAGTYKYACLIHPRMVGTVIVGR